MKKAIAWLILLGAVGGAASLYFWLKEDIQDQLVRPAPPTPLEEPAIRHPIEEPDPAQEPPSEPAEPLPALADSDNAIRDAMANLFGQNLEKFFYMENIIHRVVATVDNLSLEQAPPKLMPVKPVPRWLVTTGKGGKLSLSSKNSARYRPYVQLAEAVPTGPLIAVYIRFYPLFQEQYEKLGYPGKYFNDRVVQVIDHLLSAPEVRGPVLLTQVHVLYQFSDPNLEGLSAGQKILVRMGSENGAKVKTKLKEIRAALVSRAPKR